MALNSPWNYASVMTAGVPVCVCVCVWVCVCVCECVFLGRGTALVTLLVYLQFEQEVRLTGELVLGGMTNTYTRSNTVDVLCHTQMRS